LLLTFALTVRLFFSIDASLLGKGPYLSNPVAEVHSSPTVPSEGGGAEGTSPLLLMVSGVGLKFLGLFVMGYLASLVATKGIQLAQAPMGALISMERAPRE
jgi:hypothetical protein